MSYEPGLYVAYFGQLDHKTREVSIPSNVDTRLESLISDPYPGTSPIVKLVYFERFTRRDGSVVEQWVYPFFNREYDENRDEIVGKSRWESRRKYYADGQYRYSNRKEKVEGTFFPFMKGLSNLPFVKTVTNQQVLSRWERRKK